MSIVNVLITNVSLVSFDKEGNPVQREYQDEDKEKYSGETTNEAPIKSVIRRLEARGEKLDVIIFIESDAVKHTIDKDKYRERTHLSFLRDRIEKYVQEKQYYQPKYMDVGIADEPDEENVSKSIFDVSGKLQALRTSSEDDIRLFIESNGGVRYVLTMLLSVARTLESFYKNVRIIEVTSMVLKKNPVLIKNTKSIFDTAQMTGIVDEFINYGRINNLQKYIREHLTAFDDEMRADISGVLSILGKTSDDLQLCRASMMLEDFYKDGGIRARLSYFNEKFENNKVSEIRILVYLFKLILEELNATVYRTHSDEIVENRTVYLPAMIRWCLDKNFTQQALTLCAERMPEYLIQTGKLQLSRDMQEELNNADSGEYEKDYFFIAQRMFFTPQINQAKVNAIVEYMHRSPEAASLSLEEGDWKSMRNTKIRLSDASMDPAMHAIAENLIGFFNRYNKLAEGDITRKNLKDLFGIYHLDSVYLEETIPISNKNKATLFHALRGEYVKDDKICPFTDFVLRKKRIIKAIPGLIGLILQPTVSEINDCRKQYHDLIAEVFAGDPSLADALDERYTEKQSMKFYAVPALQSGHLGTNMQPAMLQRLLYIYSICKEQRNLSNHAHVSEENRRIALNSSQLNHLMNCLLQIIHSQR